MAYRCSGATRQASNRARALSHEIERVDTTWRVHTGVGVTLTLGVLCSSSTLLWCVACDRSGEYVKILVPWLRTHTDEGGIRSHADEWHAFSLYLNEETDSGLKLVKRVHEKTLIPSEESVMPRRKQRTGEDVAPVSPALGTTPPTSEMDAAITSTSDVEMALLGVEGPLQEGDEERTHASVVRRGGYSYSTTQIFVMPVGDWSRAHTVTRSPLHSGRHSSHSAHCPDCRAGDWSRALSSAVQENEAVTRSCWVRGPFTSPYSISSAYSNLLLIASGTRTCGRTSLARALLSR